MRNKLLLFLSIPIITLLFFIYNSFQKEQKILQAQQHLSKHTAIAFSLSHVITELQKERGLTEAINNKTIENTNNLSQLTAQWKQSNKVITTFKENLAKHTQDRNLEAKHMVHINKLESFLSRRMKIHQSILESDNNTYYFDDYSEAISQGITVINIINRLTTNIQLAHLNSTYVSLIELQEQSAKERGLLHGVFARQKITTDEFRTLSTLVSNQEIYLKDFYNEASSKYIQILDKKRQHPSLKKVQSVSQDVLNRISRQELLNELQQIIGYGGLIHLFKNYVIRGDTKYVKRFEKNFKKMEQLIQTFPFQEDTTEHEKRLFKRIVSTFDMYNHMITIVSHRKKTGQNIADIDKTVQVNDDMALEAIIQLRSRLTYYDVSDWWEIASFKVNQFYETSLLLEKEINQQIQLITDKATNSIQYYFTLALATIFTTILFAYLLLKRLVKDIKAIALTMEEMQMDNKNNQLLPVDGDDEISKMSHAFNQMILERVKFENQLQSALENAQAGMIAKSQFLSTMSHEIRTPLNGVLGMSELLSQSSLNKEQREYIEIIMNSGRLLLTIINDILDFSKLEANSVELEQISFNLEKTGFDTLQLLSAAAAEKNIELIFNYPLDIPSYYIADPSRIRQILLNLINNAIKFTSSGYVLLEFKGLELEKDLYRLTISVKDTGIGISDEYKDRLFESFTQAEQSTTRQFGGTGLGLSISQRLVELMGGRIEVISKQDEGSEFYFSLTLPVSDALPENLDTDLSDIRALVVDDNSVNLTIIEKMLQYYNIECVLLSKPEQAISLLHESKKSGQLFDVVLLDHHMPIMNGFELATIIKETPDFDTVKLLLLTSGGMKGDAEKAHKIGFSAYHTKPLRSDILIQSLINVLARKKEERLLTNFNIEEAIDKKNLSEKPLFTGHILLTEDNLVNQKVALAVFKKLKLKVDIANDGLEAIEKYKNFKYDLIFMDCLMPNMDGFEATRSIRKMEQSNEHIPIIALTANALVEDEEKCHASGMDDFVSKPFKMIDISNVLKRWLK
ncbi:MAG: response regulator [Gammaproteobacteria bacterium]|nr:response regulator [Gammaproteobacteria bacterium]